MNSTELATFMFGHVGIVIGNIVDQQVDAIVNAANSSLMGGGGVDGAIHAAGGPQILCECRELRRTCYPQGLPAGQAVITSGGNLPAHYVIHTVGPVYGRNAGRDAELLAACYRNSLAVAMQHNLRTIAFPAISTGVYGYPRAEAAAVSSEAIQAFLGSEKSLDNVRLVFYQRADAQIFLQNHRFTYP